MDLKILTISKNSIDNSVLTNKDIAKNQLEQIVVLCLPLRILLLTRFNTKDSKGICLVPFCLHTVMQLD
jgi:hypothetical protein